MRQEKQLLLDDLKERLEKADCFVLTRYQKMKAAKETLFRGEMAKVNADFEVVRKRVFLKATQVAGLTGIDANTLQGSIGVVFGGEDPINTVKAIFEYQDKNKEILEVLGGLFDGKVIDARQAEVISKLPTKNELRAQFLGLLEAPMAETLGTIEALLTSVMHCMENRAQKESGTT